MLRYFFVSLGLVIVAVVAIAGFRGQTSTKPPLQIFPDMDHQAKFQAQMPSQFHADGRAARKPVPGTVPLGYNLPGSYLQNGASNSPIASASPNFSSAPDYFHTGIIDGKYGDGIPFEVTPAVMERGKERYTINCAVCHGALGNGAGIVSNYGMNPQNLQLEAFRKQPDGQIFRTITEGKNTMGSYGAQITVEDRWAIVAYVRALQRSQNAALADVPEASRAALEGAK